MTVAELLNKYPHCTFHFMTPDGYVSMSESQISALSGYSRLEGHLGNCRDKIEIDKKILLCETVDSATLNVDKTEGYAITDYPKK